MQSWNTAGASLTVTIQSERFRPALDKLTSSWAKKPHVVLCDASSDEQLEAAFKQIGEAHNGKIDAALHSIAFATSHGMKSPLLEATREDFRVAHDISSYSLLAVCRGLEPLMPGETGGSIMSLSYIGAQRAVLNYKLMGAAKASLESLSRSLAAELGPRKIRVNVISAGPIDTLAARGISGFSDMRVEAAQRAPLKRGITLQDVGGTATFLASDASAGITGQMLYVDCGFSAVI
jgi:enoyl-[acyl-carrier protein] reductase I